MFKTYKLLSLLFLGVAFYLFLGVLSASAYENIITGDTQIKGGLTVEGDLYANHNNLFFNPEGYPGVDPTVNFKRGDSMILESGDLFILSDDYIHIGPNRYASPIGKVLIQDPNEIALKSRTANGWLAAGTLETNDLQVKNNASFHGIMVNDGALTFGTGSSADFANVAITNFGSGGFTIGGDLDMNGYDLLNLHDIDMDGVIENSSGNIRVDDVLIVYDTTTINGTLYTEHVYPIVDNSYDLGSATFRYRNGYFSQALNAQGYIYNSTGSNLWVNDGLDISGSLLATGNADVNGWIVNGAGTVYVNDTFAVSGVTDMQNSIWSSSGNVYINDGLTVANSLNVMQNLSVSGNSTFDGAMDLHGSIYNSTGDYSITINDDLEVAGDAYVQNIYPYASDNFYDIGAWNRRFHDEYLGGLLYIGANTDPGDTYTSYNNMGVTTNNSNLFLNSSTGSVTINPSSGAVFLIPGVAGTGVSYSRNLRPYNDVAAGSYDIGASGQEWGDGYFTNLYGINSLNIGSNKFTVDASGNTFASGTLRSIGLAILDGGIDVQASNFQVNTSGNMTVNGTSNLKGAIYNQIGSVTVNDLFSQTGAGQVAFSGNVDAQNGLDVTGLDLTVGDGYGSTGSSFYTNGDVSMNGDLAVDNTGLFSGMLMADAGVDTSIAGTPLNLGGTTASIVNLDSAAAGTINIGTTNASIINIGRTGSTTNLTGFFVGAGSGSGLDADKVDGKHMADFRINNGMFPVLSDATYTGAGFPNIVMCNVPVSGLTSLSSVVVTPEHNSILATPPWRSFPLAAMVFTSSDTPGNTCSAAGPPTTGTFHAIIYIPVMMGALPPAVPGSIVLNVHASQ